MRGLADHVGEKDLCVQPRVSLKAERRTATVSSRAHALGRPWVRVARSMAAGSRKPLGLIARGEFLNEFVDAAVHDHRQIVDRCAGAMVRDPILRIIVGPDLLGTLAASDLRTAGVVQLGAPLLFFHL